MFGREPNNKGKLTEVESKVLDVMIEYTTDTPEWEAALTQLERVDAIHARKKKSIDPNTVLLVAGNLLGILVIVAYEQKHVFTSKGLSHLLKAQS